MGKKLNLLLADSSEANRHCLKEILKEDWNILEAETYEEAVCCLDSENGVDMAIVSILDPDSRGLEFLAFLKNSEEYHQIPVIMNVNRGDQEQEKRALELGANDFIIKPYDPNIIKRWLSNIAMKYIHQKRNWEKSICAANERLQALVDTVPGGIAIFEISDKVQINYFNDGLCEILGYSREEMGRLEGVDTLSFVYYSDRPVLKKLLMNSHVSDEKMYCKVRVLKKDHNYVWLGISAKHLDTVDGHKIVHAVFMDLTEEKQIQQQLKHSVKKLKFRAERDTLTALYNRETFYRKTSEMLQADPNTTYVICQWNIDRFKVVNELFGSQFGDRVLCNIANILRKVIGGIGTYGRIEADHFAACVPQDYIEQNLNQIEELLSGQGIPNPYDYPILSHMGLYTVEDRVMPVSSMCDRANLALRRIKDNYLKRWNYYNAELKEAILNEQELINDMELAIAEHQFIVLYQPIVDAKTKKTISAEALVRWKHPQKGMISPGEFIPLFERNGFISRLDMYVCEEVCKHQAEEIQLGHDIVPVSVNLSRISFYNPNLCKDILDLVNKYQIDTKYIKIEITESAYKDNPRDLIDTINVFHKNGFCVLMDDFGSGYSSLNMLKDFCVDILKIDMKFMDDLEDSDRASNILFSVIQMAKSLHMETVAEGVETKNQFELLVSMGCDNIQGYYFSKPILGPLIATRIQQEHGAISTEDMENGQQTVLVVDDTSANREYITDMISDRYHVIAACNGVEALDILKRDFNKIDLIITDINMPQMNGLELLEQMQKIKFLSNIPALVITADCDRDKEEKALEYGALDVITKPYDTLVLSKRIENLLKISEKENIKMHMLECQITHCEKVPL